VIGLCVASCLAFAPGALATPTFLSPIEWSDAGQDAFDQQVAVDQSGNTLVVWARSDGVKKRIQARFRAEDGTFDPVQTISDAGQDASEPQIALDSSGNAVAVWTRFDGSFDRIQAAYRPAGAGSSFGAAQTLSPAGQDSTSPQVSIDGNGKAYAIWTRFESPASATIQSSVRPAGGATSFGAAQTLSLAGQVAYQPQISGGADGDSQASACWTRSDGTKLRVQCSRRRDVTGYPRPKGATPFRASLVPAYNACAAPNRIHGPSLAFGSCNPPVRNSAVLTIGSPDANGFVANSIASVRLDVVPGDTSTVTDEADVGVTVSITDVRNNPGGTDYTGKLLVTGQLKITDRNNAAETPETGTMQNTTLDVPVTCVATVDTAIGGSCSVTTSVDALVPGSVVETQRSIWELGQVQVKDAGPNGTGYASCPPTCGDGDETTFMREGIFVP
jgi:hypothetical protein